jgi:hypothetical protein
VRAEQAHWTREAGWQPRKPGGSAASLVLAFGSTSALATEGLLTEIQAAYPAAFVTGCSTAGEICGDGVLDDSVVVTAIELDHTQVVGASVNLREFGSSAEAGASLAARLPRHESLRHVLVFSEGKDVNGSDLVRGITAGLPSTLAVTGGLSGDGARFQHTAVLVGGELREHAVVAVAFYGHRLHVGYGSLGGWDPFGPDRIVTRSIGNVLYELDGQSALALYKRYLGDQARDLPASGLLFPLSIRKEASDPWVVRTILGVNDADESLTFAGDIPEGWYARLMKANFDRLIDGAVGAAKISHQAIGAGGAQFALLISCVGRKMVLQQRVEEEIEGVRDVVGQGVVMAGFYSYGEISPFTPSARCELHNQTMTITTFAER